MGRGGPLSTSTACLAWKTNKLNQLKGSETCDLGIFTEVMGTSGGHAHEELHEEGERGGVRGESRIRICDFPNIELGRGSSQKGNEDLLLLMKLHRPI